MDKEKVHRFRRLLKSLDIAQAVLTDPYNIQWLTGIVLNWGPAPSPFDAAGPLLYWDGECAHLILADSDAMGVENSDDLQVIAYETYTVERPLAPFVAQSDALGRVLAQVNLSGPIGIEFTRAGHDVLTQLNAHFSPGNYRSLDGQVNPLRAVKTRHELRMIRKALKLCDAGQRMARRAIHPGRTEVDCMNRIAGIISKKAGKPVFMVADFVAGDRATQIGGPASDYQIREGDFAIVDLVPRLDGFWGDNCCTYVAGTPTEQQRRMFNCINRALQAAIEMVKPGVLAREIDATVRDLIRKEGFIPHPHHTGHGIGYSYHEEPRIVGYNDMVLEKNMVICLEPGIYIEGHGGVRLEDAVRVTDDGAEVLTTHTKSLD